MKKIFLAMALTALTVTNAFAQRSKGQVTIQPKIGFNIATMTDSEGSDTRFGLNAGAELEFQTSAKVSLSAGMLYSQQGISGGEDGVMAMLKMDYLAVPLLVNYYVTPKLALKIGLQPAFLMESKTKVSINGVSAEMDLKKALDASGVSYKINNVVASIPIGISYEFDNIVLDARYNIGVSNAMSIETQDTRHMYFQFNVGYRFNL